jgi:hypothetical protein
MMVPAYLQFPKTPPQLEKESTLNMRFSVTYYLELCNAIVVNPSLAHLFINKGQIGFLDNIEHQHLYLVKIYIKSIKM